MKKVVVLLVLLLASPVWSAPFLACDAPTDPIVASEVEVDGTTVTGLTTVANNVMVLLDLVGYTSGRHIFRARWQDPSGWWSDWSLPFDAGKPATVGNVRVIQSGN